jgi:hypothetical protein
VENLEAKIKLDYETPKIASAITCAISPDNFSAPSNLIIHTVTKKNQIITEIKTKKKLSTFIATIDDLLFCISTAEKSLQSIREK